MRVTTLSGMKAAKLQLLSKSALDQNHLVLCATSYPPCRVGTEGNLPEVVNDAVYGRAGCLRSVQEEVFLCLRRVFAILDDDVFLRST